MMITGKYCTYCRKADHNDSECWCTRVGPSVPFERYVLPEPTNSAIGPAPVAAEVASIDTRPLPRSSFKYGTQDMYHGHVVRKWGQQAVADALAGQDEGLMQCVAERDHARECLLAEKQRAENAEAGREQWQKNSNFWQTLASEREAALAQVAGGQVPVEPTEEMLDAARDWAVKKYGIGIGNDAAIGCWKAMRAATSQPAPVAEHTDDQLVDRCAAKMKTKLAASRAKGRSGWETCPVPYLQAMLVDHMHKGDPVDVMVIAGMLSDLGGASSAPVAGPVDEDNAQYTTWTTKQWAEHVERLGG